MRVLTWRRDWVNCLWALKTFYSHSQQPFPLYLHDGGLFDSQVKALKRHFPNATFISKEYAEQHTVELMRSQGLTKSIAYRTTNVSTKKLFDFYLLSKAERIISIDSDIVFFRHPVELTCPAMDVRKNVYNRDCSDWYSISVEEIEHEFGLVVPPRVNSGLNSVWRESIRFDLVEEWLQYAPLFQNRWVTEQTLHAMCSTVFGLSFLPPTYMVGTSPGLVEGVVCKHYPSEPRIWYYREGMPLALRNLSQSFAF